MVGGSASTSQMTPGSSAWRRFGRAPESPFISQKMTQSCAKHFFNEQEPPHVLSRTASRCITGTCRRIGGRDAWRVQASLWAKKGRTTGFPGGAGAGSPHLRPSGPDETGEFLAMNEVKRELDRLLNQDFDGGEAYANEGTDSDAELDDVGTLYSPSANPGEEDNLEIDHEGAEDHDGHRKVDDEGDEILDPPPDHPGEGAEEKRGWPASRMKRKTPPDEVEWARGDSCLTYSIMLMRKHLTRRGLEKRQEKELRWDEIPSEFQQKFRDAEDKQWREHLQFDALEPLDDAESDYIKKNVSASRVLRSRWAYKDKNWSRRRREGQAEWKCKSRLVIAGHMDPDLASGRLATDAPTLSRPGLLCLLQLLANGLHQRDPWRVSAGDIQCAFLTGSYLSRDEELFIHQPPTGFPGMRPGQLVRVKKNIFGLATSPREWWLDLQDGICKIEIEIEGAKHRFDQCPLDPCIFVLRQFVSGRFVGEPKGYIGTHVDDLLVIAPATTSKLVEKALGQAFPVGEWKASSSTIWGPRSTMATERSCYASKPMPRVDSLLSTSPEEPTTKTSPGPTSLQTTEVWLERLAGCQLSQGPT